MFGFAASRYRFEARYATSSVDDQNRRAARQTIDQCAEVVFCFGNADRLHVIRMARINRLFKRPGLPRDEVYSSS